MTSTDPLNAVIFLTLGMALGSGYFLLLLYSVRRHAAQEKTLRLLPLHLLRLGAAGLFFWLIAQQGALALLLALLGFLIARVAVQRWAGTA